MRKKLFGVITIVIVAAVAGYNLYTTQSKDVVVFELVLANVEALAGGGESNGYETVTEDTTEIYDDATGTYKKVYVKICEGKGSLNC